MLLGISQLARARSETTAEQELLRLPAAPLAELLLHWIHAPHSLARIECAAPDLLAGALAGARDCLPACACACAVPELPGSVLRGCAAQTAWTEKRLRVQWKEHPNSPYEITFWTMTYRRYTNFAAEVYFGAEVVTHQRISRAKREISRAARDAAATSSHPTLRSGTDAAAATNHRAAAGAAAAAATECAPPPSLPSPFSQWQRTGIG